jgi:hypothetical protein
VITSVNGGSNPIAGTVFSVVVQSQNASGIPTNVTVATGVSLSRKTGTGTLGGTLSGTIAAGSNQTTITGVTYTKAESAVEITATRTSGDNLSPGDSASFTVNPGAPNQLAFLTPSGSSTAGSVLSGPPTVVVQDSLDNTVTSSSASITVAMGTNPGGGVLSGTTSKNASGGVTSFSDLSINRAGTGYTLTASAIGLTSATSSAFNISAASKVAFTTRERQCGQRNCWSAYVTVRTTLVTRSRHHRRQSPSRLEQSEWRILKRHPHDERHVWCGELQ